MSEEHLIRHCAPTLAGLKTGSLFTCPAPSPTELRQSIRSLNRRLLSRGLRVIPLREAMAAAVADSAQQAGCRSLGAVLA